MRHRWEREKDRKRGMVGERKIIREIGVEERGRERTTEREEERQGLDKDRKGDISRGKRGRRQGWDREKMERETGV